MEAAADARCAALTGAQGDFEAVAEHISDFRPSDKFWDMISNG